MHYFIISLKITPPRKTLQAEPKVATYLVKGKNSREVWNGVKNDLEKTFPGCTAQRLAFNEIDTSLFLPIETLCPAFVVGAEG